MRKLRHRALALLCAALAGSAGALVGSTAAQAADLVGLAIGQATNGDSNVLAVDATANNTQVKVHSYRMGTSSAVALQRWTFELVTGSGIPAQTYRIHNVGASKCLEKSTSDTNGANIVINPCASATNQYWTIPTDYPVNGWNLVSARDKRCLDLYNSADGAPTTMWQCTSIYDTQLWSIRRGGISCDERAANGVCLRPSSPLFGAFISTRQLAMNLGKTGQDYNTAYDYMGWETENLNNGNAQFDYLEMGWQGEWDPDNGGALYHAYWLEQGLVNGNYIYQEYSLADREYGTTADGRNHVYLTLSDHDTGQWYMYYDYNLVGTSRVAEGDRLHYLETGILGQYDERTAFPTAFDNYLQVIDGNDQWRRAYLGETAGMATNECNGPPNPMSWGIPNKPPYCYNVTISTTPSTSNGPEEFQHVQVAKSLTTPAKQPSRPEPPAVSGPAQMVHGVDQRALAACLDTDATACLKTVPGLEQCVRARQVCNVTPAPAASKAATPAVTAEKVAARASRALGGLTGTSVTQLGRVYVVRGAATLDRFAGRALKQPAHGFRLTYSADTGALVSACLGATCQNS
jgi:hypothetical protein